MRIPACQPASPPAAPLPALWPVEKVHHSHTFGKFSQSPREEVHTYHTVVKVFSLTAVCCRVLVGFKKVFNNHLGNSFRTSRPDQRGRPSVCSLERRGTLRAVAFQGFKVLRGFNSFYEDLPHRCQGFGPRRSVHSLTRSTFSSLPRIYIVFCTPTTPLSRFY